MRPRTRTAIVAATAAALAAVTVISAGMPAMASTSPVTTSVAAAPSAAAPSATAPSATAAPAATATPTASPAATATPEPTASTPSGSATEPATPDPSPSASSDAASTSGGDPSLSTMNDLGDHSMGSTVAANEPDAAPKVQSRLAVPNAATSYVYGMDVSAYQKAVDWSTAKKNGAQFAYIKASEGTTYSNAYFSQQYNGALNAGMIRGAYHFAAPNRSSGAAQAAYFVANGGGWQGDGKTLPPLLDLEYDPYTGTDHTNSCWGLSTSAMVGWVRDFTNTMIAKTGRAPAIYTTTNWWSMCTGNSTAFAANPLFIAHYDRPLSTGPGALPASWSKWNVWQYADSGVFPGDQDIINGTSADLYGLALPSALAAPKGAVDSIKAVPGGVSFAGWAFDPDSKSSIRVHLYVDSTGLAVTANGTRKDVSAAYSSAPAATGYTGTVSAKAGTHKACVIAINVGSGVNTTLGCSTVVIPSSSPIGHIDLLKAGATSISLSGWALDGDVATAIPVDVYIDGKGHRITASNSRTDIGKLYPGWGAKHGFAATYAASQGKHSVCVYGITRGSAGSNTRMGCATLTVTNRAPIGRLDSVVGGKGTVTFSGWALDLDTPTSAARVSVYVDSKGVTYNAANPRADIGRAYPTAGANHGYSASVAVKPGKHTVCAYARDTSGGSVPLLRCAVVTSS